MGVHFLVAVPQSVFGILRVRRSVVLGEGFAAGIADTMTESGPVVSARMEARVLLERAV